jgi:hypothetical protein
MAFGNSKLSKSRRPEGRKSITTKKFKECPINIGLISEKSKKRPLEL